MGRTMENSLLPLLDKLLPILSGGLLLNPSPQGPLTNHYQEVRVTPSASCLPLSHGLLNT